MSSMLSSTVIGVELGLKFNFGQVEVIQGEASGRPPGPIFGSKICIFYANFGRFGAISNGVSGARINKVQKIDPPKCGYFRAI